MKKYIYLTLTIILGIISFNFNWFFDGQTAIEAAKQVLTGFNYQEAITEMIFWTRMQILTKLAFYLFLGLFIITLFNKQQKK